MKLIKKTLPFLLFYTVIAYLGLVFKYLTFNPFEFEDYVRGTVAIFVIILTFISHIIMCMDNTLLKKE